MMVSYVIYCNRNIILYLQTILCVVMLVVPLDTVGVMTHQNVVKQVSYCTLTNYHINLQGILFTSQIT